MQKPHNCQSIGLFCSLYGRGAKFVNTTDSFLYLGHRVKIPVGSLIATRLNDYEND